MNGRTLPMESELSSFLMFIPTYIRKLMDLGFQDAKQQRKELLRFFSDP